MIILIASILITPLIFIGFTEVYVVTLVVAGLYFALTEKVLLYFISIPIVFLIEHGSYTIGFWGGLIINLIG